MTLSLCACSLDDRKLELAEADGGMAGELAGGASNAGSSATAGRGAGGAPAGAGGAPAGGGQGGAPASGGLVNGCADLDTDGIADCETTLVQTPTFSSDVSGWTPVGETQLTWDPKNALDDVPSGSAKLSAETRLAGAVQCVALSGEQLVIAYASAFVGPAGDDENRAELKVSFFEGDDCGGDSTYFATPPSAVVGAWTTIQAGGLSNATTSSVSIELVGVKAASASELNVYFDNVMLKAEPR